MCTLLSLTYLVLQHVGVPTDILAEAAKQLNSSAEATSPMPEGKEQKRSKLTACALAILGLQSLANGEGTGKDIMAAIQTNPALMPHLNW